MLKDTIYLDTAAGALKPKCVVDAISEFYLQYPINPHAIDSKKGVIVHKKIIEARQIVADLIHAKPEEVIFTTGATDSLNKISRMLDPFVKEGDEILLSNDNHSSNVLVWIELAKRTGAKIKYTNNLLEDINKNTKVVAYAQMNNTFKSKNTLPKQLFEKTREVGAFLINDAPQAVLHEKVEIKYADAIGISSNKLYGPTGSGALIVKKELLDKLSPVQFGGGIFSSYSDTDWVPKESVAQFEAGTVNTAGIIGMAAGIKFFNEHKDKHDDRELVEYAYNEISKIDKAIMLSEPTDAIVIFNMKGHSPQDVVSYLGNRDIIIRGGRMCARKAFETRGQTDAIRVTFGFYNDKSDIDALVDTIKKGGDFIDL